jgi:hypothetical protein
MKTYLGNVSIAPSIHSLTSAIDGGEWSDSRSSRFTSRERAPGTHWLGGWVGPRAGLDTVEKRNSQHPGLKFCLVNYVFAERYEELGSGCPAKW